MNAARRWLRRHKAARRIKDALDGWEAFDPADLPVKCGEWVTLVVATQPLTAAKLRRMVGNPLKDEA